MCEKSILLPYGILAVVLFGIITESVVVVACFDRCIFAPWSSISGMFLLLGLGGLSIKYIKLILGLLILILLIVSPNRNLYLLSLLSSCFLQ